jgi:MFS family permease
MQWLYLIALFVIGYDLTHSPHTVALLTFLRFLPNALLLPISGALTDRWNPKHLMIASNGGRALCMVGLLFVHTAAMLPLAYVLLFLATILSSLFRPALVATLPSIVHERELVNANGLITQIEMMALAVGPACAGVLLATRHAAEAFTLAAIVFAICALALSWATIPRHSHDARLEAGWLEHLGSGIGFLTREYRGVLAGYSLALSGMQILNGAAWTLFVVFSEKVFGFGGQGVGFLNAAYGAGGFLGGVLIGPMLARGSLSVMFGGSIVVSCLCSTAYGFSPLGSIALLFNVGAGCADAFSKVSAMSILQAGTPNVMMGRVFGAFESVSILAQLIGALAVGPALLVLGPREANFAFCAVGLALLVVCIPLLRHTGSQLESRMFLRAVPALQPVAFGLLDDLASRVTIETYPDGARIVRQGARGNAMYIVKHGRVEVRAVHSGHEEIHVANMSRMDYFGELALLRDAPRNASVIARGPVEVYRLDGEDFRALMRRVEGLREGMQERGLTREADLKSLLGGL